MEITVNLSKNKGFRQLAEKTSRRIDECGRSEAGSHHQIETVKGEIQVGKEKKEKSV